MVERRKHPRVVKNLRVRWQYIETDTVQQLKIGPVEATVTREMSKSGLSFHADSAIDVGAPLSLEIERDFGGPPLAALARVVRCVQGDQNFLIAVELTWIECAVPEHTLGLEPNNAWMFL